MRTAAYLAGIIVALVAVVSCWTQQSRAGQMEAQLTQVQEQLDSVETTVRERDDQIAEQRAQLERGLEAYLQHYRERIDRAGEAVDAYQNFDTTGNRDAFADSFELRQAELLEEARIRLQAFVDLVETWRPVLSAFQGSNGRTTALSNQLVRRDDQAALAGFLALREDADSDVARLRELLESLPAQ